MQIYLVGGAVRDQLMHYPSGDRDWVVVGACPEQMLELDYTPVGKDFPVFLHPQTKEEYALARTERKIAPGYTGFQFHCAADVTLEQDLIRRDLTINAMAQDQNGHTIDPYGGRTDLKEKKLRHISAAFAEDPVRILRVARFAARYHHLGFTVATETLELMRQMVNAGEADHLVAERIWKEMSRALQERSPQIFIQILRDCGALGRIMPELNQLFGVPQPARYHPEIDCGLHTLMVLEQAALLSSNLQQSASDKLSLLLACLLHDLGKGTTPTDILPSHHGHETRSLPLIEQLCQRLAVPKEPRELALKVAEFHSCIHRIREKSAERRYEIMKSTDAFRRPEKFELLLLACIADARGRQDHEESRYPQADIMRNNLQTCLQITAREVIADGFQGKAVSDELNLRRIQTLTTAINSQEPCAQ